MNIEQINKHLNEINEILDKLHRNNNKKIPNNTYRNSSWHSNVDKSLYRNAPNVHKYELSGDKKLVSVVKPHRDESIGRHEHKTDFMSNPTITINDVTEKHAHIHHNRYEDIRTENNINDDAKYIELSLMDLDEEYSSALRKIMK
jgi:hypothetical protein